MKELTSEQVKYTRLLAQWNDLLAKLPVKDMSSVRDLTGSQVRIFTGWSLACPSVYHEFEGPDPIPYDTEGNTTLHAYISFDLDRFAHLHRD